MLKDHTALSPLQRIDDDEIDPDPGKHVQARPLHGGCRACREARRHDPRSRPEDRPPVGFRPPAPNGQPTWPFPFSKPSPIQQDEPERHEREEHHEGVKQCDTTHGDREAVDRHESRYRRRDTDRAGERESDEIEQQHGEGAEQRGGEAPSDRRIGAEQRHPDADEELPQRRMHDVAALVEEDVGLTGGEARVGLVGPLRRETQVPLRPGILHVVGLVEDEFVRMAEVPQAQDAGAGCHDRGHRHLQSGREGDPGADAVIDRRTPGALDGGGHGHSLFGRGCGLGRAGGLMRRPRGIIRHTEQEPDDLQ